MFQLFPFKSETILILSIIPGGGLIALKHYFSGLFSFVMYFILYLLMCDSWSAWYGAGMTGSPFSISHLLLSAGLISCVVIPGTAAFRILTRGDKELFKKLLPVYIVCMLSMVVFCLMLTLFGPPGPQPFVNLGEPLGHLKISADSIFLSTAISSGDKVFLSLRA